MAKEGIQPFDINCEPAELCYAWRKWQKSVEYYLVFKNITDNNRRRATLLHLGGPALQSLYETLPDRDTVPENSNAYQHTVNILETYFTPQLHHQHERKKFRNISQDSKEGFDVFLSRLRQQAARCDFGDKQDEAIVDQIIDHAASKELRREIQVRKLTTVADVFNLAKLYEAVDVQPATPSVVTAEPVEAETATVNKIRDNNGKCTRCGYSGHKSDSSRCPALNRECNKCGSKGHFSSRCRTKTDSSGKKDKAAASKKFVNKHEKAAKSRKVEVSDNSSESDGEEYAFCVSSNRHRDTDDTILEFNLGGVDTKLLVDSGATCNLVNEHVWEELKQKKIKCKSEVFRREIFGYTSEEPLVSIGRFTTSVRIGSKEIRSIFYVVEGKRESLIGHKDAKMLGILKIGVEHQETVNQIVSEEKYTDNVGKLKDFQLSIPIDKTVTPVSQPGRRIPFQLRDRLKTRIRELLEADIIEAVHGPTPWVSPLVLLLKESGSLRMCVDMRRANLAVRRENFPIPTFDEILQETRDASIFSKIDLKLAYHQIELSPESRVITTFTTPDGIYRFKRLFFGIRCAPEMFQRVMHNLLVDLPNVKVFFDDILIFSRSAEEHEIHLKRVLDRLKQHNLTVNLKKSVLRKPEVVFLGHVVTHNSIRPLEEHVQAICDFRSPETKSELYSFLGMANYVSRFIPHYSSLTAPLRHLLEKNVPFKWSKQQENAFHLLKEEISSAKAIATFDRSATLTVVADAGPLALGAVLVQRVGNRHPEVVSYASKSLTKTEQNYSQVEKEALALVWACEKFEIFLLGKEFILQTDHRPLEVLFGPQSRPSARIERWIMRLQKFEYKVQYIKGLSNIADPLSRLCVASERATKHSSMEEIVRAIAVASVPKAMSFEDVQKESMADGEIQSVIKCLNKESPWPKELIRFRAARWELCVVDGVLLRGDRVVPPQSLRSTILCQAHEGHPGIVAMKRRLRSKVWWPAIDREAEDKVRGCRSCLLVSAHERPEPLKSTPLPTRPWEYLAMDFKGPLPSGESLLVIVDYYSRFVEVLVTINTSGSVIVKFLLELFCRFGFPKRVKTDNAQNFSSKVLNDFFVEYKIQRITSPALWPQANGEVERQNQNLAKRLKIASLETKPVFEELQKYLLAYRNTPHSTTGVSPARLIFGHEIRDKLPTLDIVESSYEEIIDKDQVAKCQSKMYADNRRHAATKDVNVGDAVVIPATKSSSMAPTFDPRPFTVIDKNVAKGEVTLAAENGKVFRRSISAVKRDVPAPSEISASSPVEQQGAVSPNDVVASPATVPVPTPLLLPQAQEVSTEPIPLPPLSPARYSSFGRRIKPVTRLNL